MKKKLIFLLTVIVGGRCLSGQVIAQELFVYTEPASNMPARSIGIRASNFFMGGQADKMPDYHFIPELMWGANKNLMLHVEGFFGNRDQRLTAEGIGFYGKYRLYTHDEVYKHFRLAAFGRVTSNNSPISREEIELNGYNSGYQLGLIATQLLHKQALSSSLYFTQALDNGSGNKLSSLQPDKAINASLSAGRLLFPKNYTGYGQTNFNVMVELLGQHLISSGKSYLDIAPAVQFIFNSQLRVDVGYRQELYSNMSRVSANGLMVRVEYLLFNAL